MRYIYVIFIVVISALVSNAQTGTVRGMMYDDATGEPILFGTVIVDETQEGESSDLEGAYSLDLEAGTYTLVFSYLGYADLTISDVVVVEGQVTTLDARLKTDTEVLEEVVITAKQARNNEAALATIKRKSTSLIDGISARKFKQTGDSNASDAVKRVTGVSVEGGKYVYVRGLGDRYTKTMLNGIDIPGLDPDRNSLQIDIFPTNLLNNMIVFKSAVAELPADFTGGVVNIETKDFPEERTFDVSLGLGYNPKMHFNDKYIYYKGSATDWLGYDDGKRALPSGARGSDIPSPIKNKEEAGKFVRRFDNTLGTETKSSLPDYSLGISFGDQIDLANSHKFGYVFSGTYKSSRKFYDNNIYGEYQVGKESDSYELVEATLQNGSLGEDDVLIGGLAGLAYKTDRTKHRFTVIHLQNGESQAGKFTIKNNSDAVGQSGYVAYSNNLEYSQRRITNMLLNGIYSNKDGSWKVDWRLSPTLSNMTDPDIRKTTFSESGSGRLVINPGAGGAPSRIWRYLNEISLVGKIDFTRDYSLVDTKAKLKFGASYVNKDRDYEILKFDTQFFGSQPTWDGDPNKVLADNNLYPKGPAYFSSGNEEPNPNAYNSNSNNLGFYLSNEFNPSGRFKVTLGLRAELFVQRHTGRDIVFASSGKGNNLDNKKVLDALDLFPSVNASYAIAEKQNVRFSYSRTIARPSFKELSFAQILDPISNRIFNGGLFPYTGQWEGKLSETRINNVDLRWELYQDRGQLFSVSLFYKHFKDPIELVRIPAAQTTNEFQPRNVGNGQVMGAEFEIKKNLGLLGENLQNLSFTTNITIAQSEIELTEVERNSRNAFLKKGQESKSKRNMAGQAPYIINAGLTYDDVDNGFNAGLYYNLKGRTLEVVGGGLFPDVYSRPFHSLNFSGAAGLGKSRKAKLSFKVDNILGNVRESVFTGFKATDKIFSSVNSGTAFSLGISYSIY